MKHFTLFSCNVVPLLFVISKAAHIITKDSPLSDGQTLISVGGNFELGFFRPGNSTNCYVGIWYSKIVTNREVVWVANRESPLNDTSGTLVVSDEGILQLNSTQGVIWSSTPTSLWNPVAQLLDNGNLVLRDGTIHNPDYYAWQSFDYPGNTLLPGMKLGHNFVTGLERNLTSWKSSDDPSSGEYVTRFDINGYPQIVVQKGPVVTYTTGPWNGLLFSGGPTMRPNPYFIFDFEMNDKEIYYKYELVNTSLPTRLVVNQAGTIQRLVWIERTQSWLLYSTVQMDNCDRYALCGPFGKCNINKSPPCDCLRGFTPKYPQQWKSADWSNGCVRNTKLECGIRDKFLKYPGVKLPDTRQSWFDRSIDLEECQRLCQRNCSCVAYSNLDIRNGGSGCLLWFNELIDIREYPDRPDWKANRRAKRWKLKAIISTFSAMTILGFVSWYAVCKNLLRLSAERIIGDDADQLITENS